MRSKRIDKVTTSSKGILNLFTSDAKVARSRPKGVLSVKLRFAGKSKGESVENKQANPQDNRGKEEVRGNPEKRRAKVEES